MNTTLGSLECPHPVHTLLPHSNLHFPSLHVGLRPHQNSQREGDHWAKIDVASYTSVTWSITCGIIVLIACQVLHSIPITFCLFSNDTSKPKKWVMRKHSQLWSKQSCGPNKGVCFVPVIWDFLPSNWRDSPRKRCGSTRHGLAANISAINPRPSLTCSFGHRTTLPC